MIEKLLVEDIQEERKNIPFALKWPSNFLSYIFHPIFIPIYVIAFLVFIHPSYFSGFSEKGKLQTVVISSINLVVFPLLSVLLLRALGFIDSIFLRTRQDRIIPYMACGIFFFWAYTVFKKQEMYPPIIATFILGVFLASSAGLIANIYFKVSMHAMGVGGLLGIAWVVANSNTMLMTWPMALAILITGLVCTARLVVSNHTQKDVYMGLLLGIASQLVAAFVS
jgi:hypothetical protein